MIRAIEETEGFTVWFWATKEEMQPGYTIVVKRPGKHDLQQRTDDQVNPEDFKYGSWNMVEDDQGFVEYEDYQAAEKYCDELALANPGRIFAVFMVRGNDINGWSMPDQVYMQVN